MARREYGGTLEAFTTTAAGIVRGGLDVYPWTARTGGTRINDLQAVLGSIVGGGSLGDVHLVTPVGGSIDFLGPDGYTADGIWVSADPSPAAPRLWLRARDITGSGGGGGPIDVPDASSTVKGVVRLAGDLGGTATNPTVTKVYTKTDVGLSNVDNTSDAAKPLSTAAQAALAAKADLVGGIIPTAQIPALALVDTVVVASQAAMLALTSSQVQKGDIAVRTDGAGTFVLTAADPSQLANWTRLNAPTDAVTSVNGQTGTVVLSAANVGAYAKPAGGIPLADLKIADLDALYQQTLPVVSTVVTSDTLVADRHTPVSAAGGPVTMTLPTPIRVGEQIRVEKVDGTPALVTISGTLRGASGTLPLRYENEVRTFIAESLTSWRVASGNTPKAGLDATYAPGGTAGNIGTADARLSDQRTPLDGSVTNAKVVSVTASKVTGLAAVATSGSAADLTGVLPQSALPPLAINDTFVVASQAAMLALTGQRGDMAVRTDLTPTRMFVLTADAPGTLANWVEVTAAGSVLSVAGRQGAVVLAKADVGLDQVANLAPAALADSDDFALAYAPRVSMLGSTITAATTLTVNRHHPVDVSSGPVTVTLPTPTRLGQRIRVEKVDSSANLVSVTGTIRGAANTTLTLASLSRTIELFAESLTSWRTATSHRTDASLAADFEAKVARGSASAGQVPTLQSDGTLAFATVSGGGGGGAGAIAGAYPISGRWYCPQGPWTGDADTAVGEGVMRMSSFALAKATTFRSISCTVTTAGSTGAVLRMVVYADSGSGQPGSLVYGSPTVDATGGGDKIIDGINLNLSVGRYWLGLVTQGTPTTVPKVRIFSGSVLASSLLGGNAGNAYTPHGNAGFQVPSVSGAPPATASGFTYINGVFDIPQVWLRAL